jgi:hypothetical protein
VDAGRPALTQRDLRVLTWTGEMYAVDLEVLGVLLARWSPGGVAPGSLAAVARKHAARFERAGCASRVVVLGRPWLVPTKGGLAFAGLDYAPWAPVGWKLAHLATVARLRLELEAEQPEAAWESERAIRARWHGTGARVRIPDGAVTMPDGRRIAVEVELHRKARHRYSPIVAEQDPAWDECWWFTRAGDVDWLTAVLAELPKPARPIHAVWMLPEGVTS